MPNKIKKQYENEIVFARKPDVEQKFPDLLRVKKDQTEDEFWEEHTKAQNDPNLKQKYVKIDPKGAIWQGTKKANIHGNRLPDSVGPGKPGENQEDIISETAKNRNIPELKSGYYDWTMLTSEESPEDAVPAPVEGLVPDMVEDVPPPEEVPPLEDESERPGAPSTVPGNSEGDLTEIAKLRDQVTQLAELVDTLAKQQTEISAEIKKISKSEKPSLVSDVEIG